MGPGPTCCVMRGRGTTSPWRWHTPCTTPRYARTHVQQAADRASCPLQYCMPPLSLTAHCAHLAHRALRLFGCLALRSLDADASGSRVRVACAMQDTIPGGWLGSSNTLLEELVAMSPSLGARCLPFAVTHCYLPSLQLLRIGTHCCLMSLIAACRHSLPPVVAAACRQCHGSLAQPPPPISRAVGVPTAHSMLVLGPLVRGCVSVRDPMCVCPPRSFRELGAGRRLRREGSGFDLTEEVCWSPPLPPHVRVLASDNCFSLYVGLTAATRFTIAQGNCCSSCHNSTHNLQVGRRLVLLLCPALSCRAVLALVPVSGLLCARPGPSCISCCQ